MKKTHQLWRLPLSGRLHASKKCPLLTQERTLPSSMDYRRMLIQHVTKRPMNNHPIAQDFTDLSAASAHLCSCARHLLAK